MTTRMAAMCLAGVITGASCSVPIPGTHIPIPTIGDLTTLVPPQEGFVNPGAISAEDFEDAVFLSPDGDREACYYMTGSDYRLTIAVFSEIASVVPRDLWLALNGHPCDNFPDLQSRVSRSDCVRCTEAIFDAAGWTAD